MKQFKININDLFEKSEVETMMDDVEKWLHVNSGGA